jgi:hypothetical protein
METSNLQCILAAMEAVTDKLCDTVHYREQSAKVKGV